MRRLLENGLAFTPATIMHIRGVRRQVDFAHDLAVSERTVRKWEAEGCGEGFALQIIGAEYDLGHRQVAAYAADMIGESLDLAPVWGTARDPQGRW